MDHVSDLDHVSDPLEIHDEKESRIGHVQIKQEIEKFLQSIQEETAWGNERDISKTQEAEKEVTNRQEENIWEQKPIFLESQEIKEELNNFLPKDETNNIHEDQTNIFENITIKEELNNFLPKEETNSIHENHTNIFENITIKQEENTWKQKPIFLESQEIKEELDDFLPKEETNSIHENHTNIFENITIKQEENIWKQESTFLENQNIKRELNDLLPKEETNRIHENQTNIFKNLSLKQEIESLLQEQPEHSTEEKDSTANKTIKKDPEGTLPKEHSSIKNDKNKISSVTYHSINNELKEPEHPQNDHIEKEKIEERTKNFIINSNTQSTNSELPIENLGDIKIRIPNIPDHNKGWITCYSEENKLFHIRSGLNSHFKINLKYENINTDIQGPFFIRSLLVKKNNAYRQFPVDQLCDKHKTIYDYKTNRNPVQATPTTSPSKYLYTETTPRSSIIHWCQAPNREGIIETSVSLMFPCNDTCVNSTYSSRFKNTEASRDLILIQTLEHVHGKTIKVLARHHLDVWIKATLCARDLFKPERRKPKGATAQQLNKKRKIDSQKSETNTDTEICNATLSDIHDLIQNGKIHKQNAPTILEKINQIRNKITDLLDQ